jgi:hypothetical protein
MKGISFITNHLNNRKSFVIDFNTLEKHPSEVEDLLDVIVAESRKKEAKLDWEVVKDKLRKEGSDLSFAYSR